MHPQADSGIKEVDEDGGNEIFNDSQTIIDNGCVIGATVVNPSAIEKGLCNSISTASHENIIPDVSISPNPTVEKVYYSSSLAEVKFVLSNTTGQILRTGLFTIGTSEIDLIEYPSGSYFLSIENETKVAHFKIIKL